MVGYTSAPQPGEAIEGVVLTAGSIESIVAEGKRGQEAFDASRCRGDRAPRSDPIAMREELGAYVSVARLSESTQLYSIRHGSRKGCRKNREILCAAQGSGHSP